MLCSQCGTFAYQNRHFWNLIDGFLLSQLVTRTKKIFVGGLSVNTTIEDVKQYFDQFGKVSRQYRPESLLQPGSEGVTARRWRRRRAGGENNEAEQQAKFRGGRKVL